MISMISMMVKYTKFGVNVLKYDFCNHFTIHTKVV